MQKIVFNRFYGGMTGDPSIWVDWGIYDGEGIDIRSDSKKVTMTPWSSNDILIANGVNEVWVIKASIMHSNSNHLMFHKNGYTSHLLYPFNTSWSPYKAGVDILNAFRYTGTSDFWVILWRTSILRWNFNDSDIFLWIAGSDIVTNGDMSSATWWTVWANWTFSGWSATHTIGSTADLSQTLTTVIGKRYTASIDMTRTAWSLAIKYNATTLTTISSSPTDIVVVSWVAVWTSDSITFTPSTDYVGAITSVSIKEANVTEEVTWVTFDENCPILTWPNVIYIGNGNIVTGIDTTLSTWIQETLVTIDRGFTIKGITRVADQIYIYATDWVNTKRYYWNWVDTAVSSWTTWFDKPVQRVISWNNQDYVIVKNQLTSALYIVNGNQLDLVIQWGNSLSSSERVIINSEELNSIETLRNTFLFPWKSGEIYSYGFKHKGFGNSLVKSFTGMSSIDNLYFSEATAYNLYVFGRSSKSWSTAMYWQSIYMSEEDPEYRITIPSTIVLPKIVTWDTYSQEYASNKLRIGYKKNHSSHIINVLEKTDDWENFCSLYIPNITTLPTVWAVYGNYTVVAVTQATWSIGCTLHCSYTGITKASFNFSQAKTSWTGDATIYVQKTLDKFKLVNTLTEDKKYYTFTHSGNWNDKQFAIEMYTWNTNYTPEFKDLTFVYEPVKSDI